MAAQTEYQGCSDVPSLEATFATGAIPQLPLEIIERIVTFLRLPDICNCMLVCKEWKECFSSEPFCKRFLFKHYDFGLEEEPTGHLKEWRDDWFCYWTDNEDNANAWVFSKPPQRWKCGIVHLADYSLQSHKELKYKDLLQAVFILARIQKYAEELQLDCGAWANEGCGEVEVCLFPWSKDTLPTPEDVLSLFHFHPEMHRDPMSDFELMDMEIEENKRKEGDIRRGHVLWNTLGTSYEVDLEKAIGFFEWMKKIFSSFIRIGIGCDQMNPVPCFILAQIAPGWVGGVLTSLALT